MGQRANFEESYTGKNFQGSYIAGNLLPDKPKWVGGKWIPEYFKSFKCSGLGLTLKLMENVRSKYLY
jgi:trehalose/maltose hydrolase-like predicted phosphorylase